MEDEFEVILIRILKGEVLQKDVAKYYAKHIKTNNINWPLLNLAIKYKWSDSGLIRIKKMAWKIVEKD
jgi:hypothetical protein